MASGAGVDLSKDEIERKLTPIPPVAVDEGIWLLRRAVEGDKDVEVIVENGMGGEFAPIIGSGLDGVWISCRVDRNWSGGDFKPEANKFEDWTEDDATDANDELDVEGDDDDDEEEEEDGDDDDDANNIAFANWFAFVRLARRALIGADTMGVVLPAMFRLSAEAACSAPPPIDDGKFFIMDGSPDWRLARVCGSGGNGFTVLRRVWIDFERCNNSDTIKL